MAETPVSGGLRYRDTDAAPVVFFDYITGYGSLWGVIEIEVAARHILQSADGSIQGETVVSGRLRCPVEAARTLVLALEDALRKHEDAGKQGQTVPVGPKH